MNAPAQISRQRCGQDWVGSPLSNGENQAPLRYVDPLLVFLARTEARAMLFAAREFDLHTAVDVLQLYAAESGTVDRIGQDAVQAILAHAFEGAA
jgi:hypothetical protein